MRAFNNRYITAVTRLLLHLYAWIVPALRAMFARSRKVGRRILRIAIEQLPLLIIH
jgi:hypothetical protein